MIAFLGYYPEGCEPHANVTLMARRQTGLDQKELAKRVGVMHQRLRAWEHGREQPSEDHLRRLKEIAEAACKISSPLSRDEILMPHHTSEIGS
jgi:ribosome-binding protein aMBF1 (putative translation factor)